MWLYVLTRVSVSRIYEGPITVTGISSIVACIQTLTVDIILSDSMMHVDNKEQVRTCMLVSI